ncbi:succinate dehydrogenase assembly factor 2 [Aurantimonas sp. C2-6-R+9]|uniref:FAD assembly factor SdhE n=2 Tax=root TaxID=1 RepID=A0A9C9TIJ1_9HYPH|nr:MULTISPECIES: succinate dehydrogenase assembly factor 2 [unclassified Aurantimonas]MEC5290229.1 succinate dehydrogenase assembly factor 2 [Aurantimonas sp. C2-3-R2]MEC5321709.1 succinate dehydrogenase assembly factor 2 [Aurantimonas sp. A3-2-R12]MEC5380340.1 succinate dehydrogenase assembly factor 2 [Aurantimonas sp. C2-6-R+9]MEC5411293.1 succinate dehydrogenase assembly factor 2 [Aurantimonas sp. C2-4-R8]HDZ71809.1 succinate dehydrogenase assembly factor 2 family protein [Aurantimonas cora
MTGMQRSSSDLDVRRRKALFRSWHRGIREMDLVLGRFADAEIDRLTDAELHDYEQLMEAPDRDLFQWLTGETATPANFDTSVFRRIRDFHVVEEEPRP